MSDQHTSWPYASLTELRTRAAGRRSHAIGIVDGPVDGRHPALRNTDLRGAEPAKRTRSGTSCRNPSGPACAHGTFVAGQLAALCPMSTLVLNPLFCEAADLDQCPAVQPRHLAYALERLLDRGVRIINMSVGVLGGPPGSLTSLHRAYARAQREGVLLVAAAGNGGQSDVNPLFRHDWVIPVAAHDQRGRLLPTSNRGGFVAQHGLLAPGEALPGIAPENRTTTMSGTSVAAPLVSGAAALLWSLFPHASAHDLRTALLRPDADRSAEVPPTLDLKTSAAWLSARHPISTATPTRPTMTPSSTPPSADPLRPRPHPGLPSSPRAAIVRPPSGAAVGGIVPQACACTTEPVAGFVYSTGVLVPRFPDEGDRREFQSRAREQGVPNDDFYAVLSVPSNRYLARRICWSLVVDQRPSGVLLPRSEGDLTDLINALGPEVQPNPEIAVTGTLGRTAPPELCDGLRVPTVGLAEVSYFTQAALRKRIHDQVPLDGGATSNDLDTAITRIWTLLGLWRTPGFDDAQRAKNYLALRTTTIYTQTVAMARSAGQSWLTAITAEVQQTEDNRSVVDLDARYDNAAGQTITYRAEIDVTDLFPFQSKALFQV